MTFASLFSIGLGIGKPDEIAVAGLLHDVGIAKIPYEIQERNTGMTADEKKDYEQYLSSRSKS